MTGSKLFLRFSCLTWTPRSKLRPPMTLLVSDIYVDSLQAVEIMRATSGYDDVTTKFDFNTLTSRQKSSSLNAATSSSTSNEDNTESIQTRQQHRRGAKTGIARNSQRRFCECGHRDQFNLRPRATATSSIRWIRVCQNQQPAGELVVLKNLSSRCSKADPNSTEDLNSRQGGSRLVSRLREPECIVWI